jgi:hypothetical protein
VRPKSCAPIGLVEHMHHVKTVIGAAKAERASAKGALIFLRLTNQLVVFLKRRQRWKQLEA